MVAYERKVEKKSETNAISVCYSGFDGTLHQYWGQSSNWAGPAIQNFAAHGGDLVHLAYSVCLVCLGKEKGSGYISDRFRGRPRLWNVS